MNVEGIIRAAADACEPCRRYGCTLDVMLGGGWGRQPVHVTVTPDGVERAQLSAPGQQRPDGLIPRERERER